MQPEAYRPVITKVLRDAGLKNPDAVAGVIVNRMAAFNELVGEGAVLIESPIKQKSVDQEASSLIQAPSSAEAPEAVDIYKRVSTIQRQYSDDQVEQLKVQWTQKYKQLIPGIIPHMPPGFNQPLQLTCMGMSGAPGNLPFVRIIYAPPGQSEVPLEVRLSIYEQAPSAEDVIAEIKSQADKMYRPGPVQAPPPMMVATEMGDAWGPGSADSKTRPINSANDIDPEFVAIKQRQEDAQRTGTSR